MWEAQFWTFILAPIFAVVLPILAITLENNANLLKNIDSDSTLSWFKMITDLTTFPLWYVELTMGKENIKEFKDSLIYDGKLHILVWFQWFLLPLNMSIFGTWTIILFPITLLSLYLNNTLWRVTWDKYMNYFSILNT